MAPGDGDVSMARDFPWKSVDLNEVLEGLEVSGSVYFLKTLGQCDHLILPMCFIKEYAEKVEEWVILRTGLRTRLQTFSTSKPWRVTAQIDRNPKGSLEVRFVDGWREFATDNRLSEGDLLIFVLKLDARSKFEVYIFRGTSVSVTNSQVPARQWSIWERMPGCKVEKDAKFSGRYNLRSAGDGNMREGGELYSRKKRKVDEAPSSGFDVERHRSGVKSEAFTGSKSKGFVPWQHGANSQLPSFYRPIKSFDGRLRPSNLEASSFDEENDGRKELAFHHGTDSFPYFEKRITSTVIKDGTRFEVPVGFVRTHGKKLNQAEVKFQGIHHESPVQIARLIWSEQVEAPTRLYFRAEWSNFMKENGLHEGQWLRFTLTAASFFVVQKV
ncbi:hypothetical protein KC19_6G078600 [Ceratodon purpureus]|uniref:TF-B3 domain-containing protein n=2 Tax=Ceratodon purpureus TaxID=3225 RepID=A0A8T0HGQ2_CERPU|nr:hypothetical protein KC19_6G078600 [Ceratodon purpureus]